MSMHDYFAELYVAGRLADAGWNVYFPHRDHGFDFIITKNGENGLPVIRPVQVKGKYPQGEKTDKTFYGFVGGLTQVHPEMVLAIPYFATSTETKPEFVAYMPYSQIRPHSRGYRCGPALFRGGEPVRRRDFTQYFDASGIRQLELNGWKDGVAPGAADKK